MSTLLAWRNVLHDKQRTLTALSAVIFAIFLLFMQLGFYTGAIASATMVYDTLRFDAIVLAKPYVHMRQSYTIPRAWLSQGGGVRGVEAVMPVYVSTAEWRNIVNYRTREILLLGVCTTDRPFTREDINCAVPRLRQPDTGIMDRIAKPPIGPHPVGTVSEVNGRRIEVVADYSSGTGLLADGTLIVSDVTLSRLTGNRSLEAVNLGLVSFAPGADPAAVLAGLRAALPSEANIWSREELRAHEQHYFIGVKPIGILFSSGLYIGFIVGAVILYQILSADVAKRIRQYATLKAVGYGPGYVSRVVMVQGLLLGGLAYVPAIGLAAVLYAILRATADLPVYLTVPRAAFILAMSLVMCLVAGFLAIRKVNRANPADLF